MKDLITRKDIGDFFDEEYREKKEKWEALMKLPIKDRIRKRKAIKDVVIDKDYTESTDISNTVLYKLIVDKNLSDFKEGEPLLLHKEGINIGVRCTLIRYDDDKNIIIGVNNFGNSENVSDYYDLKLVLDADLLDLRTYVFDNFVFSYKLVETPAKDILINTGEKPILTDVDKCKKEVEGNIEDYKQNLTDSQKEAVVNSLSADNYYLIQGPPGTGKSFVLGLIIAEEVLYAKHKVIVIGPTHLSVNNTLEKVLKLFPGLFLIKIGDLYRAPKLEVEENDEIYKIHNYSHVNAYKLNNLEGNWVIGLTPHSLYCSRARGLECDTLIIDEAGQMNIPLAMMGMFNAKKIIMAGDHKQLPPIIISDKTKDCLKESIFQRMMQEDNYTILDVSFRMCEKICDYVSELFYDGVLKSMNKEGSGLIRTEDKLYDFGSPIIIHNIDDEGKQTSDKEAEFIVDTIAGFLEQGLKASDIAVLAPFRAQAANIRRYLRKDERITDDDRKDIVADTIDSMQGQEREVIIFSLTAGDKSYMEEMGEFLYNPNKLNVAFSRAKSKLIIVGNIERLKIMNLSDMPHIERMLNSDKVIYY